MGEKFEYGSPGPKKVKVQGHSGPIEVSESVAKVIEAQREPKPAGVIEKKGA